MTPRHALQSAALQFGRDGTDRSLAELLDRVASYLALGNRAPFVGRDESTPALSYGSGDAVVHAITESPDYSRSQHVKYPIAVESCTDAIPALEALAKIAGEASE